MTSRMVAWIAAAVTAALIGVDVYLAIDGTRGNTWSEVIRYWASRVAIIPWAWGVLAGHFFHPQAALVVQPEGVAILLWLTVVVQMVAAVVPVPMLLTAALGAIAGAILWQA